MKMISFFTIAMIIFTVMCSCKTDSKNKNQDLQPTDTAHVKSAMNNKVKVVAKDFTFQVKNEILSGWNTFQFKNKGHTVHFFLFNRLPDTISFSEYHKNVSMPFQVVFDSIKAGTSKADAGAMLGSILPSWSF